MYSLKIEQRQYQTYILKDESSNSLVEIVPERGGIITKWLVGDRDIMYLDTERFTNPELSVRGGNPVLFPICGNLPDNSYTHNGKQYTLKQHGFARDLPWDVDFQEAGNNSAVLTLVLKSSEATKQVYPFDFEVRFTYEMVGNSLNILQTYQNKSDVAMPCSFGFHPYFLVRDKSKLSFEIPSQEYFDHKTKENKPFSGNFDFNQDEIDVAFTKLSGNTATVTDRDRNLKFTLEYDRDFSTLVFWTVKGKEFYCIEPWSAARNSLNTGKNLTVIEPGDNFSTSIKLTANFF
ncbi:aldose epimerase family protein [Brunnivagina elsteri]|uniref:Aldose epimerase n=1 Tax=Brunnivagina elsteri CCALA 953 TaxID=987040 RepID=A0A2A2TBX1_9CYAN|nr:aldose epimerase [Calothrix elsteri]PAX51145.1 aldose epimerase [Calothrix elsteri CCALA 953]